MQQNNLTTQDSVSNKKEGLGSIIFAIFLLTSIGGIAGWLVGTNIGKEIVPAKLTAEYDDKLDSNKSKSFVLVQSSSLTKLPPFYTSLASPIGSHVRLEVYLVTEENVKLPDVVASEISTDILSFLHSSSMEQLSSSSGLLYLKEDLLDRAKIRSKGLVKSILISSLVLQ